MKKWKSMIIDGWGLQFFIVGTLFFLIYYLPSKAECAGKLESVWSIGFFCIYFSFVYNRKRRQFINLRNNYEAYRGRHDSVLLFEYSKNIVSNNDIMSVILDQIRLSKSLEKWHKRITVFAPTLFNYVGKPNEASINLFRYNRGYLNVVSKDVVHSFPIW